MKKESYLFIKKIGYMLVWLVSILLVFGIVSHLFIKNNKVSKVYNINSGWNIEINNKIDRNINIINYKIDYDYKGTSCILTYNIKKDYNLIFPAIFIKTDNYLKEVLLDNKEVKIEQLKKDRSRKVKRISQYYTVVLPKDYAGKTIKLIFDMNYTDSIVNRVQLMSENDFVIHSIRTGKNSFLLSTVMCILGILLILVSLLVPKRTNRIKKLFWTGTTFLFASLSLLSSSGVLELITNSNRLIKNIKFTGLFLCIPSVLMIAYNTFKNKKYKRIMYIYNIALYIGFVIFRLLNNFSIISYKDIILCTDILIIITAILLLIYNLASLKKVNVIEKIYTIGISICYIESIVAVINYIADIHSWQKYSMIHIVIGVFTFFIVTMIYYAYVADGYISSVSEKNILSKFAYTDPLTGIMNRSKYEEVIKELMEKDNNVTIITFDLNDLKKINDNIGHESGDIYIKSFAEALERIFDNCDFIGRIGGDEFSVIIENKSIQVAKYARKLDKLFKKLMKEYNYEFEASFAHGCANTKEDNLKIEELINLADSRMYDNKKKQKQAMNINV